MFQGVEVNGHADYPSSLRRISNIFSETSSSSGGGSNLKRVYIAVIKSTLGHGFKSIGMALLCRGWDIKQRTAGG